MGVPRWSITEDGDQRGVAGGEVTRQPIEREIAARARKRRELSDRDSIWSEPLEIRITFLRAQQFSSTPGFSI